MRTDRPLVPPCGAAGPVTRPPVSTYPGNIVAQMVLMAASVRDYVNEER